MRSVLIAGGGIAGLASAIALARNKFNVEVFERKDDFSELGAGIQLAPNALAALQKLGVLDDVLTRAIRIESLVLRDAFDGSQILRVETGSHYLSRFKHPYCVVHRGELFAALLRACQENPYILLKPRSDVSGFEDLGSTVRLHLSQGEAVEGIGLVGADGMRSRIRKELLNDGLPRVSGHTIFRALVDREKIPVHLRTNEVTIFAGPKWHLVHYPVLQRQKLNIAITIDNGAVDEVSGESATIDEILAALPGEIPSACSILQLSKEWRKWVLCDREPILSSAINRVILLGDSSHGMLQYAAQGAAMALEDAVALLRETKTCSAQELPDAFRNLSESRWKRCADIQLLARRIGDKLYHASGTRALARNRMLKGWSRETSMDRIDWIHGYRHE
jgi:2-polyprenyl-6-methoxyphenol hydroxylase-like FAD-dependent oxidoreductase